MELKEKYTSVDTLLERISTIVDCELNARISPGLCAGAFLLSLQQESNLHHAIHGERWGVAILTDHDGLKTKKIMN